MENVKKQGIAPFNAAPGTYQVFRNVLDFGAKGNGIHDDTAAIQAAISAGQRCAPGTCASSTTSPAIVYFPPGTYLVSSPISIYYMTQMIGNPNCLPTIKASSSWPINIYGRNFVFDADAYQSTGNLAYGATNVFWRQIRNFVIDLTAAPLERQVAGIHWPTAQATSLQNIVFKMSSVSGTQHEGVYCEGGSGGVATDLTFYGGLHGIYFVNQQFTMRNLTFYDAATAIYQLFDWGWLYKGLNIKNCTIGIDMTTISVGSLIVIDSVFTDVSVGIATSKSAAIDPPEANTLVIENVQFNNVPTIVSGLSSVPLQGSAGSITVAGWAQGHYYLPNEKGPYNATGTITPNSRGPLAAGADFYERSKPQYENYPASSFYSVRDAGAKGDGVTDDSDVLITAIAYAAGAGKILYFDAGIYLVTKTIYIPSGSKITGESYPVILSSGPFFADMANPKPVVQVGKSGEVGTIEWTDMIVSTKGAQAGAILIEYNLASVGTPSGIWDVHTRIGGFAGSDLQLANCPATNATVATVPAQCIAAFMSMHITTTATRLYMENVWLWTADHDVEDATLTRISIYTGRGLLIESSVGEIWLYGTAVEHHALYQYQLADTGDIFMGFIQTETAYYQPNPDTLSPFPAVAAYNDPVFAAGASGWGLRVLNSNPVLIYGAGLYSFFNNYNVHCSDQGNGETCQSEIFSIENSYVSVYGLNTVGTGVMITQDGTDFAKYADNSGGFVGTIAYYRS